ncbi:Hypothetical protein CINCED_3A022862 [Cinara cedri]|uniref:Uncharacterized protein n=1 Tax=Cinara cedri TaxID=506608 RepID=A0A5E4MLR7_9HEMI|nr:Hypothetical protein CINCED_3A022862 [Cinara cedri]
MFAAAAAAAFLLLAGTAMASEYPERECCDPVDPPPPVSAPGTSNYDAGQPAAESTAGLAAENSVAVDVRRVILKSKANSFIMSSKFKEDVRSLSIDSKSKLSSLS